MKVKIAVVLGGLCLAHAVGATEADRADTGTMPAAAEPSVSVAPQRPWRGLIGAGLTWGGDELVRVLYTDGSTDRITAGGSVQLYVGVEYRVNTDVSIQGTLGLHIDSTKNASNGEVTFSRVPLELLGYYHANNALRFGAGLRLIGSPRLRGTGVVSSIHSNYDSTIGLVLEGEYQFDRTIGIKLRHVSETYRESTGLGSYSGDHFGLLVNFYF